MKKLLFVAVLASVAAVSASASALAGDTVPIKGKVVGKFASKSSCFA